MFIADLVNCSLYMNINVLRHKPTEENELRDRFPHLSNFVSHESLMENKTKTKI